MRLKQLLGTGAIASIVIVSSIACQQPSETIPPSDETVETPDAATNPGTAEKASEAETPASDVDPSTIEAPEPPPATAAAPAPEPTAVTQQACSVTAFVADTDPAGLNVRSGPGSNFDAIDALPTNEPVEVSIVGATDGWFLINEAYRQAQQELEQPGWVYAPLLGVTTTSLNISDPDAPATLYEAPDGFSNVNAAVPKFTEVTLLSCSGNWLQVQSDTANGWLAVGEQCSNPTSTCP